MSPLTSCNGTSNSELIPIRNMPSGEYSNDQLLRWTHEESLIDSFIMRDGGRCEIWLAGYRHDLSAAAARRMLIRLLTEQSSENEAEIETRTELSAGHRLRRSGGGADLRDG